jgi:hypothetical protein
MNIEQIRAGHHPANLWTQARTSEVNSNEGDHP